MMVRTDPDPWRTFAQVEAAGMLIGIAAEHVLRALPRPASLTSLPRNSGQIDGVFRDGAQLVSVVDLGKWISKSVTRADVPEHIMLLGAEGRSVGIAVDAVRGMVRLRASKVERVHHEQRDDEFFHSVGTLDDGRLITLLDPEILMGMVGASTGNAGTEPGAAAAAVEQRGSRIDAVVRIGTELVGLPALQIGEIVKEAPMQAIDVIGSEVLGMMQWRGHLTPVIDTQYAELGTAGGRNFFVIIAHDNRTMAIPVDEVQGVHRFANGQMQSAAQAGLDADAYTGAATLDDGRQVRLLDVDALLTRYAVAGVQEHGQAHGAAGQSSTPAHVVFDAGYLCATPMERLKSIVRLPANYRVVPGLAKEFDGQCDLNGKLLPVVDLRESGARDNADACLMLALRGDQDIGFLVHRVVSLVPANTAEQSAYALPGGERVTMITVGKLPDRQSYRVIDLGRII